MKGCSFFHPSDGNPIISNLTNTNQPRDRESSVGLATATSRGPVGSYGFLM